MKKYFYLLLAGSLFLTACARNSLSSRYDYLADTFVEIKVIPETSQPNDRIIEETLKLMKDAASRFDIYSPKSEISKINQTNASRISLSKEMAYVLETAQKIAQLSSGAFDATIYPLTILWDINRRKIPPSPEEIKEKLPLVDYRQIKLDGQYLVKLNPGSKIDLNGIAKGYLVDLAAEYLQEKGIRTGLVNAGGNIRCFGNKVFSIGVRHPRSLNDILTVIKLKNQSIATSGDYENYFFYQGKRYHHLLQPDTGYPAATCISVSIISKKAIIADALSTAVFVAGAEKGLKLIQKFPDTAGLIVTSEGKIIATRNWPEREKLPRQIKP